MKTAQSLVAATLLAALAGTAQANDGEGPAFALLLMFMIEVDLLVMALPVVYILVRGKLAFTKKLLWILALLGIDAVTALLFYYLGFETKAFDPFAATPWVIILLPGLIVGFMYVSHLENLPVDAPC